MRSGQILWNPGRCARLVNWRSSAVNTIGSAAAFGGSRVDTGELHDGGASVKHRGTALSS